MRDFLLSLLPPWNLARLFSAYRILEAENAALGSRVAELEEAKAELWDYVLMLRGAPPLAPREKKEREPQALPPRPSLRQIRRRKVYNAFREMMKPEPEKPNGQPAAMAARADEFAKRVSA